MTAVPCAHWRPCGVKGGGCCALGKHGGKPSVGTCVIVCLRKPELMPENPPPVQVRVPTAEERAKAESSRIAKMRATWATIHGLAAAGKLTNATLDEAIKGLPCGTCMEHFRPLRESEPIPPDADGQFALSVGWHNVVNVALGKPTITVYEARKLYPSS